jgi:hypothetical protein
VLELVKYTHVEFTIKYVYKTSEDNDEVKDIPRITKIVLVCLALLGKKRKHTHALVFCHLTQTYI